MKTIQKIVGISEPKPEGGPEGGRVWTVQEKVNLIKRLPQDDPRRQNLIELFNQEHPELKGALLEALGK